MNQLAPIASARLPQTYEAARTALSQCSAVDECKEWADKAAALASYARQSQDDQLEKMAQRIRARADGDDADFYVACAVDFIKDTVKRCIGEYTPRAAATTDRQIVMDGFDHMQRAYTVMRGDELVLVPVQLLSDEEIEQRALEYEAMARGCIDHAKELRAYRRRRCEQEDAA